MAEHTVNVNIVDRSVPIGNHKNIAIINKPNPAMNVDVDARELYLLINNPSYFITDSETGNTINGVNYYDYFPEASPGGGGGGSKPKLISKSITENGVYYASEDNADGYKSVDVDVPESSSVGSEDVKFYDYDGTVLYSYSTTDFAALTAMPANPSHDGLTAQGWNWSLTDAKTYVASYGKLNIGQMYRTTDGKTHIHIVLEDGRLEPVLTLGVNGSVDIDWGDGTAHATLTGTNVNTYVSTSHKYAKAGEYTIKLDVTGNIDFMSNSNVCWLLSKSGYDTNSSECYRNAIKEINVGSNITSIRSYAFSGCSSLSGITIPSSTTSIGSMVFKNCFSLRSITIPLGVTNIPCDVFYYCYSLSSIAISSSVTGIGNEIFYYCHSLNNVTIPSSVTRIGTYAFNGCYSLNNITIPSSVTSINEYAFSGCSSLNSITIPSSVTSIGMFAFDSCSALSNFTIPSGVTSIEGSVFKYCSSLTSITIPQSVTKIGYNAFNNCYGLGKITFESDTPPTAGSSAFTGIPTDCKIYVPSGSLSAYTSAQYYPSSSTYTYIEY